MDSKSFVLQCPLPPKSLFPNSRVHWSVKNCDSKNAKWDVVNEIRRVYDDTKLGPPEWEAARVDVRYFHKAPQRPDRDNLIAALKPYFDGMEKGGLIENDRNLLIGDVTFERVTRLPRLELTVTEVTP